MSRFPVAGRWSGPILGLALLAPSLAGQTIKLSAPLARPIGGDVIAPSN